MPTEEPTSAPVKLHELADAFEFVSVANFDEHQAYICKSTGRIIFVAEGMDLEEDMEFPDDPEPADYLPVPHRRNLGLGRRLALAFVAEELPGAFDKAREIFSRKERLWPVQATAGGNRDTRQLVCVRSAGDQNRACGLVCRGRSDVDRQ